MFGLAGNDWPSDLTRLATIPASLNLGGKQEIVNDAFVALRAGANHPWGVALIAGTGSVVAGRNQRGEEFRTLGLGPLYGDWGGSTEIADEGLRAVAEAFTGLGPPTALTAAYMNALDRTSAEDLLEHSSRTQPPMPRLASLVLEAADEGDAAARAIAERAGTTLGANAGLVARKLDMQEETFEVVMAGGVLRAGCRTLEQALKKELRRSAPGAFPVRLEVPPVVGAALRALENIGRCRPSTTGSCSEGPAVLDLPAQRYRSSGCEENSSVAPASTHTVTASPAGEVTIGCGPLRIRRTSPSVTISARRPPSRFSRTWIAKQCGSERRYRNTA